MQLGLSLVLHPLVQLGVGLVLHLASLEGMYCDALWLEPVAVVPDAFVVCTFETVVVGLKLEFGTVEQLVEQLVEYIALKSDSCASAVLAVANAVGVDMWVASVVAVPVVLEGQSARNLCWQPS